MSGNATSSPRPRILQDGRIVTVIGPTVSLEARPIVVPILSCVFGFPVLALAIICALRYRAKRARKRSRMKRLQAASWRQEETIRSTYSVVDIHRDSPSVARLTVPRDPTLDLLELPPREGIARVILGREPRPVGRKPILATPSEQNGKLLRVPGPQKCDLDILAEHSDVDFEYSDVI